MQKAKSFNDYYNDVSSKFLEEYCDKNKDENIVFSPYSIISLLSMITESTAGDTKEEMMELLNGFAGYPETLRNIVSLNERFAAEDVISNANALCVRKDMKRHIKENFQKDMRDKFSAEVFSADNLVKLVNSWVKEKTKDMIPAIMSDDRNDLLLSVLNAIAFDAVWKDEYRDLDVKCGDFHNSDGSIEEDFFLWSEETEYINENGIAGFIKPYKDCGFSYMAILPQKESDNIDFLLRNLDLTKIYESRKKGSISVRMPEFGCDFKDALDETVMRFGISKVFSDHADFSPLSDEWLRVSSITHKACISVDRKGTKAVSVTFGDYGAGGFFWLDEKYERREITLDRPFIYAVIHNETGLPVFAGVEKNIKDVDMLEGIKTEDVEFTGFIPQKYSFKKREDRLDMCSDRADEIRGKIRPVIYSDPENYSRLRRLMDQIIDAERNTNIQELDLINHTVNVILSCCTP